MPAESPYGESKRSGVQPTANRAQSQDSCPMGLQVWGASTTPPTWSARAGPWKEGTEDLAYPVSTWAANSSIGCCETTTT